MKICVKFSNVNKQINVDDNTSFEDFGLLLSAETEISVPQQRLIASGTVLTKDNWRKFTKEGSTILLLGCKTTQVKNLNATTSNVAFDQLQAENLKKMKISDSSIPVGLINFGTTCYMNSSLQCLCSLNEFREELIKHRDILNKKPSLTNDEKMIGALSTLFLDLRSHKSPEKNLLKFFDACCLIYPEYRNSINSLGQQDAHEFTMRLLEKVSNSTVKNFTAFDSSNKLIDTFNLSNFTRYTFGLNLLKESVLSVIEEPEENPSQVITEELYLSCYIDNTTNSILDGIKKKFQETVTQKSPITGNDRQYTVTTSLTDRLPMHLQIHMERFYVTVDRQDDVKGLKILRNVRFPINLDVYELCDSKLKKTLDVMRQSVKYELDKCDVETKNSGARCWNSGRISLPSQDSALDSGSNGSGYYYLKAIVSHQGRSLKVGHYLSWVFNEDTQKWYCINDNEVYPVKTSEISALSGGYGDGDISYILFYSSQKFDLDS